jgi:hypothetical protein
MTDTVLSERVSGIRDRVLALIERMGDPFVKICPVTIETLDRCEHDWRLSFPPEYRELMLQIGSAPGPGAGLYSPEDLRAERLGPGMSFRKTRSRPTLSKAVILTDQGCGSFDLVVTAGLEAGRVWTLAEAGLVEDGAHPQLLDWYEAWLDEALASAPGPAAAQPLYEETAAAIVLSSLLQHNLIELASARARSDLEEPIIEALERSSTPAELARHLLNLFMRRDDVADVFASDAEMAEVARRAWEVLQRDE